MTKASAMVIAGGLVAALLAGMVGVARQTAVLSRRQAVVIRTVQAAPAAAPGVSSGEED